MVWISDGSNGFSINGNVVTHINDSDCDNVFNCMWEEGDDGVSSGQHYWKIHFHRLEGGGGVGLTTKDYFKQGYGCDGLCYNGNLSDRCSLLVGEFGPTPRAGDTVGILAWFKRDRLKVYIDINGKSLGIAFNVQVLKFPAVFPIVCFKNSGSATCQKETEIPNIKKRCRMIFNGIEGHWKLKNSTDGDDGLAISTMLTRTLLSPKMNLQQTGENEYRWYVEVMNSFQTTLSETDGKWKTDGIMRTLIGSSESVLKFERQISDLMDSVDTLSLEIDGSLLIKSGTLSTVWKRYDAAPGPYTTNLRCEMM